MKKKKGIAFIMLLCLLLTSLTVYFIYEKYKDNINKHSENKKTDEEKEMDQLVNKLYKQIHTSKTSGISVYSDQLVTYTNLSDIMKFTIIYDELIKNDAVIKEDNAAKICLDNSEDYLGTEFYENYKDEINNSIDKCTSSILSFAVYKKEDVEKTYLNYFGTKNNIPQNKTSLENSCTALEYNNKTQEYLIYKEECGDITLYHERQEFEKYEKQDDKIYIYDYFLSYTYLDLDLFGLYKDNKLKNFIRSTDEDFNIIDIKKEGQLFKHTFQENNNGKYVWISSEPVE